MKHPIINKILTEWSHRVHDGMPNTKNPVHLVHLRESLRHLKIDEEVIDIMMTKLYEDKDEESLMVKVANKKGLERLAFDKYKDSTGNIFIWDKDKNDFNPTGKKVDDKDVKKPQKEPSEEKPPTKKVDGGEANP